MSRTWCAWVVTRALALASGWLAYTAVRGNVFHDLTYYADWAQGYLTGHRVPYRDFDWEYPPGALVAMVLPGTYSGSTTLSRREFHLLYGATWICCMLAVDLAVLRYLLRRSGRQPHPAATAWLYGLPLLGPLTWSRYDLLPAGVAVLALMNAGRGSADSAGWLAGAGATLKIWPLLLAPVQRTRRAAQRAMTAAAVLVAFAAAASTALTGRSGFAQVLRYQDARGLQIESLAALPFAWCAHLHLGGYTTRARFGAVEILGPAVPGVAQAATVAFVAGLLLLGVAHWRFMRPDAGPRGVSLTAMAGILLVLVTDKVLSPQYLLWLLAILAGACLLDRDAWSAYVPWALAIAALTQVAFPWFYEDVRGTGWWGLLALTARDLLLLGLAGAAWLRVVRSSRHTKHRSSRRHRSGAGQVGDAIVLRRVAEPTTPGGWESHGRSVARRLLPARLSPVLRRPVLEAVDAPGQ